MNIFEFAIEKEKYSEHFYRQLAARTTEKQLKAVFNLLADEEARHCRAVEQMKAETTQELSSTDLLSRAKDVFARMRNANRKFDINADQIEIYKKAQDIEKDSREFYSQKANEAEDQRQKAIFTRLADEEKNHYALLENIIEFLSRPQTWLENAEFYHLDEY